MKADQHATAVDVPLSYISLGSSNSLSPVNPSGLIAEKPSISFDISSPFSHENSALVYRNI